MYNARLHSWMTTLPMDVRRIIANLMHRIDSDPFLNSKSLFYRMNEETYQTYFRNADGFLCSTLKPNYELTLHFFCMEDRTTVRVEDIKFAVPVDRMMTLYNSVRRHFRDKKEDMRLLGAKGKYENVYRHIY